MPNRKNAILQLKKDAKRRERARAEKSILKTTRIRMDQVLTSGNADESREAFKTLQIQIDKSVKKGILPKNRAARIKSRYSARINKITS